VDYVDNPKGNFQTEAPGRVFGFANFWLPAYLLPRWRVFDLFGAGVGRPLRLRAPAADWWPAFVARTPTRQILYGFLPLTGSTDRLGDDLAECFAEGFNINRRWLQALYKRESGVVLAYVRRA
jgi:hypothetical protein